LPIVFLVVLVKLHWEKATLIMLNVLRLTEQLGSETTLFVDLQTYDEYKNAVSFIRTLAEKENIHIKK
jgi:hypothetical protein